MARFVPPLRNAAEIIEISAGSAEDKWLVHKNLIISDSPTAQAMLATENFVEGREGKIKWPELDSAAFDEYVGYLYGGNRVLPVGLATKEEYKVFLAGWNASQFLNKELSILLEAYVVADVLGSAGFFNELMIRIDSLLEKRKGKSTIQMIKTQQIDFIVEHTVDASPLRTYILEVIGIGLLNGRFCLPGTPDCSSSTTILPARHEALYLRSVLLRHIKDQKLKIHDSKPRITNYLLFDKSSNTK